MKGNVRLISGKRAVDFLEGLYPTADLSRPVLDSHWIGYIDDGELVGVLSIIEGKNMDKIASVYVDPEHRRKGIGQALVDAATLENDRAFCTYARPASVGLFLRAGFTKGKTLVNGTTYMKRRAI